MTLREYFQRTSLPTTATVFADYAEGKTTARKAGAKLGLSHQTVHNKLAAAIRYAYKSGYEIKVVKKEEK